LKFRGYKDYSKEVKPHKRFILRHILILIGTISLILGFIGIFLPVLPTTPFILLSAICYSRASTRFYNWLMNSRIFGPTLRRWKETGCISLRVKISAISLIVITMGISIIFWIPLLAVKIIAGLIGLTVIIYIIRIPTLKSF
jgi:uncharacterized membrane protein YbaN (DUF454 family)